jgi:transcriptional regulator with PAS, ATPase and Fis domain
VLVRKYFPFIAVNCGAIPEGTIDSELFGHEKGSFTGAVDNRKGYFETVNGGTIFLDEIGEMPLGTQARLLRVLETGEYIRVGSSKVQKTDVRVVAATNRDLLNATQQGKFREDLYYRLNTVPIRVPSLRDRREDIPVLFRKFCVDFAERYKTTSVQLDEDARQLLVQYNWPGNIRELKNIAEQISVLSKDKMVNAPALMQFLPENKAPNNLPVLAGGGASGAAHSDFASERDILYKLFFDMKKDVTELKKMFFEVLQNPNLAHTVPFVDEENLHSFQPTEVTPAAPSLINSGSTKPLIIKDSQSIDEHEEIEEILSIADKERELIVKALRKHKGKRKDAALDLGISERTLYRKLKEYNIHE